MHLGGRARLAFVINCLYSMFAYKSFTYFSLLNSLSNGKRVSYEEVRLPPANNQRCDLYVDDEVEVRHKAVYLWTVPCDRIAKGYSEVHWCRKFKARLFSFKTYNNTFQNRQCKLSYTLVIMFFRHFIRNFHIQTV